MARRRTFAEVERAAMLGERDAVIAHLLGKADKLTSPDRARRPTDDQRYHARRLRALAGDLVQALHKVDHA